MATLLNKVETVPARPSIVTVPHHVKSPRLGWLRWGALVGLVLALSVAGVLWRAHLQDVIMYETVAVERGSVQAKVTATGNLNAVVNVLVSSQVSGNIKDLYADWNSKVKKGQLVALIDPEIFQAQVDQVSASFRSAHASTMTAQSQLEKAKADLNAAIATERNAQATAAKDVANEANARDHCVMIPMCALKKG